MEWIILKWIELIFLVLYFFFNNNGGVNAAHSSETQHRTKAASEKQHDLWCHRCNTMVDSKKCLNLTSNHTSLHAKCSKDEKKCMVRRISMSTSTEDKTGKPNLWLLERNCSETCESGCIVIGERTKLHSCITCCDEHNFCNSGSSASRSKFFGTILWQYMFEVLTS